MMLTFVYGHDAEVANFVAQFMQRSSEIDFGRCKTIGVIDEDGKLIAGLVYFNYDDNADTIEIGVAGIDRRFINRTTLRRIFEYPFIECGCQMVFSRVRADNEKLLDQLARLNFNFTLLPRMYGRGDDGVICTLTDDQWLDSKFSKRIYRGVKEAAE